MNCLRGIELTPRLLALAEQVPQGARFADIGTDHARLPVWLIEHGVVESAIAADLREGPLDRARETARRHQVTDRISFRLGDGLAPVRRSEADVIAIAGMGGESIAQILAAAPWTREEERLLLLQPMTSVPDLRRWLAGNGYRIQKETLIREGDTLYILMTVTPGRMPPLTPAEEWAGRQWRGMDCPLRAEFLDQMAKRCAKALAGLGQSNREEDRRAVPQWEARLAGLETMRKEWEAWQK